MKVHLIKEKTIRNFVAQYPGSKVFFEEWLTKVKLADWDVPGNLQIRIWRIGTAFICLLLSSIEIGWA